ncbi:LexA family protein [Raoultibacter timonensis]|uniref:LexA family protein n=1 Tax=Raoultibacter timonensis TaxID=1907662 RepID=UPI0026DB0B4B|nr:XRE family transcriptional regulator [Raoultibacter timonensis]
MASISNNIKRLREKADMSQEELGAKLGKTRSAISQYESGKIIPRMGVIEDLATLFRVQKSEIIGDEPLVMPGAIYPSRSPRATAPLLGRIHAGTALEPDILEEDIDLPYNVRQKHPNAYFLEVEGDCMNKVYPEGCYILVDPDVEPRDGSIAAVAIDGADYVMRRLRRGANSLMLSPESTNASHSDIVITESDDRTVELAGTVVWYQAAKEME